MALVQTATTLPVVFFGVAGGALADLADRRRVLLATQAMMLAAAGALALLDGIGAVSPLSLLALTFALGIGTALNNPAWQAIQPELVPHDEFPQAVYGLAPDLLDRGARPRFGRIRALAGGLWDRRDRRRRLPSCTPSPTGGDAVVAIGTLAFAAALLGLAVIDTTAVTMALVAVAGAAWLLCLSTLNVASQQAVPGWVPRTVSRCTSACSWAASSPTRSVPKARSPGARSRRRHCCLPCDGSCAPSLTSTCHPRRCSHPRCGSLPRKRPDPHSSRSHTTCGPRRARAVLVSSQTRPSPAAPNRSSAVGGLPRRRTTGPIHRDIHRTDVEEHLRQHERPATDLQLQDDLRPFLRDGELPHARHYTAATRHLR